MYVYLDDSRVGSVGWGSQHDFPAPPGPHTVRVRIQGGLLASIPTPVQVDDSHTVTMQCQSSAPDYSYRAGWRPGRYYTLVQSSD